MTLDASGTGVGAGDTDDNDEEDDEPVPPGRWVDGRRVLDEEPDVDDAQRARAQAEEDRRVREAVERAFDIDR